MNYELCKKLKDAGFPLKQDIYSTFANVEFNYQIPTLSELIEAAGDRFSHLNHWTQGELSGNLRWSAGGAGIEMDAPTSEEAVAKLWLALQDI